MDRLRNAIEASLAHLKTMIALMEAGTASTSSNGRDTTSETLKEYQLLECNLISSLAILDEQQRAPK